MEERAHKLKLVASDPTQEQLMSVSTVLVEPPREMSREDRRLVFAKIDEHYLDNSYEKDWNDRRVATDLGVPLAWVQDIRDVNFGPEGLSTEQLQVVQEAKALVDKLKIEANIIDGHIQEGMKARDALLARVDEIIPKLTNIEAKL